MIGFDEHRDFLLAAIRAAFLRCRLTEAELTTVGTALRSDLITPDVAVRWLREAGLLHMLGPLPESTGRIDSAETPLPEPPPPDGSE
jgi:hypothetical protein